MCTAASDQPAGVDRERRSPGKATVALEAVVRLLNNLDRKANRNGPTRRTEAARDKAAPRPRKGWPASRCGSASARPRNCPPSGARRFGRPDVARARDRAGEENSPACLPADERSGVNAMVAVNLRGVHDLDQTAKRPEGIAVFRNAPRRLKATSSETSFASRSIPLRAQARVSERARIGGVSV